eukprot:GHVQ01040019.1.p1 GENE.GHVQ01040019.1~~GHVQ01040019.1.p1  ORF type:complete len:274 (+),score=27.16 GHVQ01040019.1:309-1130(+)
MFSTTPGEKNELAIEAADIAQSRQDIFSFAAEEVDQELMANQRGHYGTIRETWEVPEHIRVPVPAYGTRGGGGYAKTDTLKTERHNPTWIQDSNRDDEEKEDTKTGPVIRHLSGSKTCLSFDCCDCIASTVYTLSPAARVINKATTRSIATQTQFRPALSTGGTLSFSKAYDPNVKVPKPPSSLQDYRSMSTGPADMGKSSQSGNIVTHKPPTAPRATCSFAKPLPFRHYTLDNLEDEQKEVTELQKKGTKLEKQGHRPGSMGQRMVRRNRDK